MEGLNSPPTLEHRFESAGLTLSGHLARPSGTGTHPGVVLCHGFPAGVGGGLKSAHTYPQLADRLAEEVGCVVLAFNFRGCRPSEGQFSLQAWIDDVSAAVDDLAPRDRTGPVSVVGFGTGGAAAICAAAADPRITGVAAAGAPADFTEWAKSPRRLLEHARSLGIIDDPSFPDDQGAWSDELGAVSAEHCASQLGGRDLLLLHGADDLAVPVLDARAVGDAHGDAELRVIDSAGHNLRHDPRAVAILIGWLDRTTRRAEA